MAACGTEADILDAKEIMSPNALNAYDEVLTLLTRYNPNNIEISGETNLNSDLNIDSVSAMDLIMEIEDRFEIDIPINLVSDVQSVQDLVDVVKSRVEAA